MSRRRAAVAVGVLAAGVLGTGIATSADATPPCDQAAQACQTYDHLKGTTVTFLDATYAACDQNVPGATGCAQLGTVGGTAYTFVFFPYDACYDLNGQKGCVGPL